MKATIELSGWAGTQSYKFEGEDANDVIRQFEKKQELDCLYRMGYANGEKKATLNKLGNFLDKYHSNKLTKEDLESLDIKLSVGSFKCTSVE